MHPLPVQNFGGQENSCVQRKQPHSQKRFVITLSKVYHILKLIKISYIQNQKKTRKHKTKNTFVQKMLELTREILNWDEVFKN